jgi:capsular polysaccharide biosynthesis protein
VEPGQSLHKTHSKGRRVKRVERRFFWLNPGYWLAWLIVDRAFYFQKNTDVALSGLSAVRHYLKHGAKEGRYPNAFFELAHNLYSVVTFSAIYYCKPTEHAKKGIFSSLKKVYLNGQPSGFLHRIIAYYAKRFECGITYGVFPLLDATQASVAWIQSRLCQPEKTLHCKFPATVFLNNSASYQVTQPAQYHLTVMDAAVVVSFQVISHNHFVVYEAAAHPKYGFVAGVWPHMRQHTANHIKWFSVHHDQHTLDEAILLAGRCSPNYFHVLIEYLARARWINAVFPYQTLPLIFDKNAFPQEVEALKLLFPEHPIVFKDDNTILNVRKLHIFTQHTFLPDTLDIPLWQGAAYCHDTLAYLRDNVLKHLPHNPPQNKRIYLDRRAGRNVRNRETLYPVLEAFGIECIDTADMSFLEQVQLFQSASLIVGPMGAAFSNLIFCQPGTQVLAICSPFAQTFCMQANLAQFAQCHYVILPGKHPFYRSGAEHTNTSLPVLMDSYTVNATDLEVALNKLIGAPQPLVFEK